jgi:hypothetical protein
MQGCRELEWLETKGGQLAQNPVGAHKLAASGCQGWYFSEACACGLKQLYQTTTSQQARKSQRAKERKHIRTDARSNSKDSVGDTG